MKSNARQALEGDAGQAGNPARAYLVPAAVQRIHARISKTIAVELVKIEATGNLGLDPGHAAFCRTRRDHRKRFRESAVSTLCCAHRRDAGTGPGQQQDRGLLVGCRSLR